jgi:hypothetical protein
MVVVPVLSAISMTARDESGLAAFVGLMTILSVVVVWGLMELHSRWIDRKNRNK